MPPHPSTALLILLHVLAAAATPHPLDPLTPTELNLVASTLKNSSSLTPPFSIHYAGLDDPDKSAVLSYLSSSSSSTPALPRRAVVIVRASHANHQIIIDLSSGSIEAHEIIPNSCGFPTLTFQEQGIANKLPFDHPPFLESLKKRGLKAEEVACGSFTVGWYGDDDGVGRKRVVKVMCYSMEGTVNLYMRPIEGVSLTVDLDEMRVIGFIDRVVVLVPKAEGTDYREDAQDGPTRPKLNLIGLVQPNGPTFTIDGHIVK